MEISENILEYYVLSSTICNKANSVITDKKFKILFMLHKYKALKPNDLISKLGIFKTNLTKNCTELKNSGLISVFKSKTDSRGKLLCITPKGEKVVRYVKAELDKVFANNKISKDLYNSFENITKLLNQKI